MAAIHSKKEMYELYYRGKFGNMVRTWTSLAEYENSGYTKPVTLRYAGKHGGGWLAYDVPQSDVASTVNKWVVEGADPALINLNEALRDDLLELQGEIMRSTDYISLRYSTLKKPMRLALAEGQKHDEGLAAVLRLKTAMDDASWDDLQVLLDEYPDSVIEFSTWSCSVGFKTNRNTIFWEVRNY